MSGTIGKGYSKKKSILFVDDEVEVVENYRDYFEDYDDLLFVSSNNARDALTKIRNQRFDVICTDFRMPEVSGYEFIREVRKTNSYEKMPFVVITAFVEEAIAACRGISDIMFLSKPVNLESVAKLVLFIAKTGKLPSKAS